MSFLLSLLLLLYIIFPGHASGKEQCRRHKRPGFNPWVDNLEEGTAIHSSILTWRIPWREEPEGLKSMELQRVEHNWSYLAHMQRPDKWLIIQFSLSHMCLLTLNPSMPWINREDFLVFRNQNILATSSCFLWFLRPGNGEDSWESLGLQGHPTSPFWRRSGLGFLWKEWC